MSKTFFVNIFPTLDRRPQADYRELIKKVAADSSQLGVSHTLITVGDKRIDPWVIAQACLEQSQAFNPIIAVNPLYTTPVETARKLIALQQVYGTVPGLNIVSGSFFQEMKGLYDTLTFDERSARLLEFFTCVSELLSTGRLTFKGTYYRYSGIELYPRYHGDIVKLFVSGSFEEALKNHRDIYYVKNLMPQGDLRSFSGNTSGLAVGICARSSDEEAAGALESLFPADRRGEMLFELSLQNSETPWNQWLKLHRHRFDHSQDYCLKPLTRFWSAAPFIVASYDRTAELLKSYASAGHGFFMLDYHPDDVSHVAEVLRRYHKL